MKIANEYRKKMAKSVVIKAVLWDGSSGTIFPLAPFENVTAPPAVQADGTLEIETLEGVMTAQIGDWIIRGTKGEIYPCKPDVFADVYEPV